MSKDGGKREKMGSICQDLGSRVLEQCRQPFWHQGPVLWKSIFAWTRGCGGETVSASCMVMKDPLSSGVEEEQHVAEPLLVEGAHSRCSSEA